MDGYESKLGMKIDKILTIPIPYRYLLIDLIPYRFDSLSIVLSILILTFNLIILYYIVFIIIQYKYLHALTTTSGSVKLSTRSSTDFPQFLRKSEADVSCAGLHTDRG